LPMRSFIGNKDGGIMVLLVIVILVFAGLGGGAYWAYGKYFRTEPRLGLATAKVKPEVMQFVYRFLPKAHALIISLDDDIALMDSETKRLEKLAKKFPRQKELIDRQLKLIAETRSRTAAGLEAVLTEIQTIYVTWLIDPVRGKRALADKRRDLIKSMAAVRKSSGRLMARLRATAQRTGGKS